MADDPIAEALHPRFAAAAKEARDIIDGGGVGAVEVLFGHLPKAVVSITEGPWADGVRFRNVNVSIPSVIGGPNDPDSIPSFFSRIVDLNGPQGTENVLAWLLAFENDGPSILANAVRSCVAGLLHTGIGPGVLISLVEESAAASVMST